MTKEEFKSLQIGDLIRSRFSAETWVVTANYGNRVTAAATADVTNPPEWKLVSKAPHE